MRNKLRALLTTDPVAAAFKKQRGRKPAIRHKEKRVLVSQFAHPVTAYANSLVAQAFAADSGIPAASFNFDTTNRAINAAYDSFGAPLELSNREAKKFETAAASWARQMLSAIGSKEELLEVELEGVRLGPLIYDSYLRYYALPTVDLQDERLVKCATEAAKILFCCTEYFDRWQVEGVFPDHMVYNKSGIIAQLAWQRGIPVYFYRFFQPFYIHRIPEQKADGLEVAYQHPFDRYPQWFSQLTEAEQNDGRARAREALERHLTGKNTNLIFGGHTAYGEAGTERLFPEDKDPRVLVLLHDFCDAPHVFGRWLFPDFYAWINYLLTRAQETGFQWIVKPHPNLQHHGRDAMGRTNNRVLDELKEKFPNVTFLEPGTSNRQILQEGVAAMFTVYGSAGHEFAYSDIPVVNAGPNPHMGYPFNIHCRTLAEYDACIFGADKLQVKIKKSDIEEFYYMSHFYLSEKRGAPFEIVPPALLAERKKLDQWESLGELVAQENEEFRSAFSRYVRQSCNNAVAA